MVEVSTHWIGDKQCSSSVVCSTLQRCRASKQMGLFLPHTPYYCISDDKAVQRRSNIAAAA